MSDYQVVRCLHCDQATVTGDVCRHCQQPLSGHEPPYVAFIPAASQQDWSRHIKPLLISYAVLILPYLFGFNKFSSVLMVLITIVFAIKILRDL